jgi:hypothetical protein
MDSPVSDAERACEAFFGSGRWAAMKADEPDQATGFLRRMTNAGQALSRARAAAEARGAERMRASAQAMVQRRADIWNGAARSDEAGACAESLADECEDIVAVIRALPLPGEPQPSGGDA